MYNIKKRLHKLLREQYFTPKLSDDIKEMSVEYVGDNITWYGNAGQMVVLTKNQIEGRWGNIYDNDKLNSIIKMVKNSEDNIEFECSYGIAYDVSFTMVKEEQESYQNGSFGIDYDGKEKPFTIGDDELDSYIGDDNFIEDNLIFDNYDVKEFYEKYKFSIVYNKENIDSLKNKFKVFVIENDIDLSEDDNSGFDEFLRLEVGIVNQINGGNSDVGKVMVQIRDGHHRVMGAFASGEKYVCVNLTKKSVGEYPNFYNRYKVV